MATVTAMQRFAKWSTHSRNGTFCNLCLSLFEAPIWLVVFNYAQPSVAISHVGRHLLSCCTAMLIVVSYIRCIMLISVVLKGLRHSRPSFNFTLMASLGVIFVFGNIGTLASVHTRSVMGQDFFVVFAVYWISLSNVFCFLYIMTCMGNRPTDDLPQIERQMSPCGVSTLEANSIIERLTAQTYAYSEAATVESAVDARNSVCLICLQSSEEGDLMRELKCHHLFHASCVDLWLTQCTKRRMIARCPIRCEEKPATITF